MRYLVIIACILMLSACSSKLGGPKAFGMGDVPDGPPDFQEGWRDGCKTGMGTMAPNYYKTFYKFTQNTHKIQNKMYYQAWKDAYTYCRQYTFRFTLWKFDAVESW